MLACLETYADGVERNYFQPHSVGQIKFMVIQDTSDSYLWAAKGLSETGFSGELSSIFPDFEFKRCEKCGRPISLNEADPEMVPKWYSEGKHICPVLKLPLLRNTYPESAPDVADGKQPLGHVNTENKNRQTDCSHPSVENHELISESNNAAGYDSVLQQESSIQATQVLPSQYVTQSIQNPSRGLTHSNHGDQDPSDAKSNNGEKGDLERTHTAILDLSAAGQYPIPSENIWEKESDSTPSSIMFNVANDGSNGKPASVTDLILDSSTHLSASRPKRKGVVSAGIQPIGNSKSTSCEVVHQKSSSKLKGTIKVTWGNILWRHMKARIPWRSRMAIAQASVNRIIRQNN